MKQNESLRIMLTVGRGSRELWEDLSSLDAYDRSARMRELAILGLQYLRLSGRSTLPQTTHEAGPAPSEELSAAIHLKTLQTLGLGTLPLTAHEAAPAPSEELSAIQPDPPDKGPKSRLMDRLKGSI